MLEVRLLGQFDVRLASQPVDLASRPAQSLFAFLLLHPGRPFRREQLAGTFWPNAPEANARNSLRQAGWRIRKALAAGPRSGLDYLVAGEFTLAFNANANYWLDVAVLEAGAAAGSVDDLIRTVSVYGGELLPGFYDDWLAPERERLQAVFERKIRLLVDHLVAEQRWPDVLDWGERWIALSHAPEPAFRALMYAHSGLGDRSGVSATYRRCVELLRRDLGVAPAEQTGLVYERLSKGEKALIRGYELHEIVGAGELGVVYRATQPLVGREVAIKVVPPQLASQPDFIRRFESEAQLIARLEHLHIRPLYDYWREPDGAFLVMRWLRGENLRHWLDRRCTPAGGPWEPEAVLRLLGQVGAALHAAHRQGVVHGNLKPDNILFDEDGNAYLTDFSIAESDSDRAASRDHSSALPYRSPEQRRGEPPSLPGDVFSLGVIAAELLGPAAPQLNNAAGPGALPEAHPPWQSAIAPVLQRATAEHPAERYPDALAFTTALSAALANKAPIRFEVANPYKGLRAFEEADAADFFGREALVDRLLARLNETSESSRFLALVGPSGCGKSSAVMAGLLPALRRGALAGSEKWYFAELLLGPHPLEEVELALLRLAANQPAGLMEQLRRDERGLQRAVRLALPDESSELLLFIDQFEQLFGLVADRAEITQFLDHLFVAVTHPRSRLRVVITLRADCFDRPLMHLGFGSLMRQRTEVVVPLTVDELRRAVVAPAERFGLTFEPGLATAIVTEVNQQPSALPLLQYALTELFERRTANQLTRQAYQAIGGVFGALARQAEVVYAGLDASGQGGARQLFLRLVTLNEDSAAAQRRVLLAELSSMTFDAGNVSASSAAETAPSLERVIEAFVKARLLTLDHDPATRGPTVQLAHEALISEWHRLREWLAAGRADLRLQRQLAAAVAEWHAAELEPGYLLQGPRLEQFATWARTTHMALTQAERAFLHASQAHWDKRQAEEAARGQREAEANQKLDAAERRRQQEQHEAARRLSQRNRMTLVALGLTLSLALLAGFFLTLARQQAAFALSRQLADQARRHSGLHFDQAVLLSLEALRFADTYEARNALVTILQAHAPLRQYLPGHEATLMSVAYSPDGTRLASADADGLIRLWRADGERDGEPLVAPAMVTALAFTPDGASLVSAGANSTVVVWDLATRQAAALPVGEAGTLTSLAIAPNGRQLAVGSTNGTIVRWDLAAGRLAGPPLAAHQDIVRAVAFSPDGRWLASGADDDAVGLWNLDTLEQRQVLGHRDDVVAVAFSLDGNRLATGSRDGAILLWQVGSAPQLLSQLSRHKGAITGLAFSPHERRLASSSADGTIVLWDMIALRPVEPTLSGHAGPVTSLAFSPGGETLASGGEDDAVILWDVPLRQRVHGELPVTGLAFSPGSDRLASASIDQSVRLWDVATGGRVGAEFTGHRGPSTAVAYSPDGRLVASAGGDATIILWDLASRRATALTGHQALVTSVAFSPDGQTLASASADGTLRLWDVATAAFQAELRAGDAPDWILSVAFSPDGTRLATAGKDTTVRLWDVRSGRPIGAPLAGHQDWVYSIAFSPDGQMLASGSADNTIILWSTRSRRPIGLPLRGHAGYVFSVAFSPNAQILASGSADNRIILWDVKTRQTLGEPFAGHAGDVYAVAFSPNGHWLASGSADATFRLWNVAWPERACALVGRNLSRAEWSAVVEAQPARGYLLDRAYEPACAEWPAEE